MNYCTKYSGCATGVHGGTYSTILYPQTPRLRQEECVLLSPINIVLTVISSSLRFWKTATGQSHIAQKGQRTHFCGHPMSVEPGGHIMLKQPHYRHCRGGPTTTTLSSVTNAMRSWNLMIGASKKQRRASNSTTGQPSCNWS